MAHQAVAALGWIPTRPHTAWCPTSNLLALEANVAPGDAAVFVLDLSCPKARSDLIALLVPWDARQSYAQPASSRSYGKPPEPRTAPEIPSQAVPTSVRSCS